MSLGPGQNGKQHTPRTLLAILLLAGAALTVPLGDEAAVVEPVQAQLDDCNTIGLDLDTCAFEITLGEWSEAGEPGTTLNGTVTIENTGDGIDAYTVEISTDNETWSASVDPTETDAVDEGDTVTLNVTVDIPEDAGLDDSAEVNVTATSQNDDEVSESLLFDAISGQVFAWTLGCDETVTVQTGSEGMVALAAVNGGNGADQATLSAPTLPDGVEIGEIDAFDLQAGDADERNVTVGLASDVEEGDHDIEWELVSAGSSEATATCITTLTATTESVDNGDGGEEEDSPLGAVFVLIAALGLAVAARRRGQ